MINKKDFNKMVALGRSKMDQESSEFERDNIALQLSDIASTSYEFMQILSFAPMGRLARRKVLARAEQMNVGIVNKLDKGWVLVDPDGYQVGPAHRSKEDAEQAIKDRAELELPGGEIASIQQIKTYSGLQQSV